MIASPSLLAIGQGLMSTFRVDEASSHWIGFQVIAGFGLGLGMQASSLAAQAVLPMPDVPIGIAIMFFAQQLGGGIFTSVGQNLLSTYLVSHLDVPGLSAGQIMTQGARELVSSVAPEYQLAVKTVYNQAISQIFRCAMGVALVAVVAALFMEWKNVKKGGPPPKLAVGSRVQSSDNIRSDGSSGQFLNSSPKFSSDNHSALERKYEHAKMKGAMIDGEEMQTPASAMPGCEHCEHCRLSRALTLASFERQSQSLPHPSDSASGSQTIIYPTNNTPSPEALEEAARLAAIAREAVAQLEELTRPFPVFSSAPMGRAATEGALVLPDRAYHPRNGSRRHSAGASESSLRRLRREPTTPELVENARRVSAQLEHEDREGRVRQREARRERREASSQSSRRLPAIPPSTSSSSQASAFQLGIAR